MTAPKTQIQALINKIDEVLQASEVTRGRSPQDSSTQEDVHQQQVLEQARNYLASLQGPSRPGSSPQNVQGSRESFVGGSPNMGESPSLPVISPPTAPTFNAGMASPAESAQQVLQAVVQEMNYLRVNMMQPLREELMSLYQQRQMLTADIKRLEQQRYQLMLANQQFNQQAMIEEFLQSLMGRLQEQLASQIAQTYANLELNAAQLPPSEQATDHPQLTPGQRLQHMQQLQETSDEVMLKLDSTLRVVFESLQTNVESYQDSLSQGLEKMHGLGQQGEAMFAALVNRFAQHLGRGASYYLQSSLQKEWELPGRGVAEGAKGESTSKTPVQSEDQVSVPDKLPDDDLNRMIGSLADEDAGRGSKEGTDAASGSDSGNADDGLIDELLDVLGAGSASPTGDSVDDIDFNLDDIDLVALSGDGASDGLSDADFAESGFSGAAAEAVGDRPLSGDDSLDSSLDPDLTLFEIQDDGVQVHINDERVSQIEDADTDDFLNDLSAYISSEESSSDDISPEESSLSEFPSDNEFSADDAPAASTHDPVQSTVTQDPLSPDVPTSEIPPGIEDDDEALAFLNQIATEMEHDLSEVMAPGATVESQTETTSISESLESETVEDDSVDDFSQMFDTAVESSDADEAIPEGTDEYSADEDVLSGLFDEPDSLVSEDAGDGSLEGESGDTDADMDDNLWANLSDLGISTQDVPASRDQGTLDPDALNEGAIAPFESERVETISSLVDLVDDADVRASLQADLGSPKSEAAASQASASTTVDDYNDDRYIVASPDEDLLMAEDSDSQRNVNLSLDDNQRQQLASDLANVEGLDPSDILGAFDSDFSALTSADEPANERIEEQREISDPAPLADPSEGHSAEEFLTTDDMLSSAPSDESAVTSESAMTFESAVTLEGFSDEMTTETAALSTVDTTEDVSSTDAPVVDDEETLQGFFEESAPEATALEAHSPEGMNDSNTLGSANLDNLDDLDNLDNLFGAADDMSSSETSSGDDALSDFDEPTYSPVPHPPIAPASIDPVAAASTPTAGADANAEDMSLDAAFDLGATPDETLLDAAFDLESTEPESTSLESTDDMSSDMASFFDAEPIDSDPSDSGTSDSGTVDSGTVDSESTDLMGLDAFGAELGGSGTVFDDASAPEPTLGTARSDTNAPGGTPSDVGASDMSGFETATVQDLFGDSDTDDSDTDDSDKDGDREASGLSSDMTVESLFAGDSESQRGDAESSSVGEEFVNPFDADEELQGIFEDLQAFHDADVESSQAQEEKTLMDLMKGFNQPTLPPDEADSPMGSTDTSWSIFDDVNDPNSDSEEKHN